MKCQRCGSDRIAGVSAKCSDCCSINYKNFVSDGYVPEGFGVGGGDYVEFDWCLECGQIQREFPVEDPNFGNGDNWYDI